MGHPATQELQKRGIARLTELGSSYVIGVDEVGLGSWAGPVTVCAAVARADWKHPLVKDSKKVDKGLHERIVREVLVAPAVPFHSIRNHDNKTVDAMGVAKARDALVLDVVARARKQFPHALVVMDGNMLPRGLQTAICFPKADDICAAVSAASILAKRGRDEIMREFNEEFPQYGFDTNAGYRSPKHVSGLETFGPCLIHRLSFQNIAEYAKRPR